jgi:hypothetical protein
MIIVNFKTILAVIVAILIGNSLTFSKDKFTLKPAIPTFNGVVNTNNGSWLAYGNGGDFYLEENNIVKRINIGFDLDILQVINDKDSLVAFTREGFFLVSKDNGKSWKKIENIKHSGIDLFMTSNKYLTYDKNSIYVIDKFTGNRGKLDSSINGFKYISDRNFYQDAHKATIIDNFFYFQDTRYNEERKEWVSTIYSLDINSTDLSLKKVIELKKNDNNYNLNLFSFQGKLHCYFGNGGVYGINNGELELKFKLPEKSLVKVFNNNLYSLSILQNSKNEIPKYNLKLYNSNYSVVDSSLSEILDKNIQMTDFILYNEKNYVVSSKNILSNTVKSKTDFIVNMNDYFSSSESYIEKDGNSGLFINYNFFSGSISVFSTHDFIRYKSRELITSINGEELNVSNIYTTNEKGIKKFHLIAMTNEIDSKYYYLESIDTLKTFDYKVINMNNFLTKYESIEKIYNIGNSNGGNIFRVITRESVGYKEKYLFFNNDSLRLIKENIFLSSPVVVGKDIYFRSTDSTFGLAKLNIDNSQITYFDNIVFEDKSNVSLEYFGKSKDTLIVVESKDNWGENGMYKILLFFTKNGQFQIIDSNDNVGVDNVLPKYSFIDDKDIQYVCGNNIIKDLKSGEFQDYFTNDSIVYNQVDKLYFYTYHELYPIVNSSNGKLNYLSIHLYHHNYQNLFTFEKDITNSIENIDRDNLDESSTLSEISIFPNPVRTDINVSKHYTKYEIRDINGNEVAKGENNNTISVSNLVHGTYFLTIFTNSHHKTFKFIKE